MLRARRCMITCELRQVLSARFATTLLPAPTGSPPSRVSSPDRSTAAGTDNDWRSALIRGDLAADGMCLWPIRRRASPPARQQRLHRDSREDFVATLECLVDRI